MDNLSLYTVFSLPHISQIYMFFKADLQDLDFSAGHETLETRLFHQDEIPWDQLAFPVITRTLERYFEDREKGDYPVLYEEIEFRRKV